MAKVGDVYRFLSNQVTGSHPKPKYHIAISLNQGYFLYISSNAFEGDMTIDRLDWPEMPKTESFVSFSRLPRYGRSDLEGIEIEKCGEVTIECLARIRAHATDSLVMEQWQIDLLLEAIDALND